MLPLSFPHLCRQPPQLSGIKGLRLLGVGVGQWGEQSGWTAGKQPGAGSNLRQPELCLTPGAPCPLHCPAPCCRDRDRLGLEFVGRVCTGTDQNQET